jgi:hypothetical protein
MGIGGRGGAKRGRAMAHEAKKNLYIIPFIGSHGNEKRISERGRRPLFACKQEGKTR